MNRLVLLMKRICTKSVAIIFLCILLLSIFFFWNWFGKQYEKVLGCYYINKGDRALKRRDLIEAIDYYRKGLQIYKEHAQAACNLGNIYVAYEDYYSAVEWYERALKYRPNFLICRLNLAIVLAEKLTLYDEAINQYKEVISSAPLIIDIPFLFKNANSVRSNKGKAFYNMGIAYRSKALLESQNSLRSWEFTKKARLCYLKALEYIKDDYDTHYNLALADHLLGNNKEAGKHYCEAISIKPLEYQAHYNLAILLRHMNYYKESLSELEKAVIIADNTGDTNTSRYIFDVLNDVTQKLVNSGQYKYLVERISDSNNIDDKLTYINGKLVSSEAFDEAINKNMGLCSSGKIFE